MTDLRTAERTPSLLDLAGKPVSLVRATPLGEGGEARVLTLPGRPDLVVKLYRHPQPEHARKLAQMLAAPPALQPGGGVSLAWPREPLVDASGQVVGFVMARATGVKVFELFNPATRRALEHRFHWALLHRVAANLASALDALHARGYVVGDVNESNLLVEPSGAVTLVDTDSFQVPDPIGGGCFRARVGRPEYTPPELQGMDFGSRDRLPVHDRFGLAVLVFQLLMEGTHPFAVRSEAGEESATIEERIRAGRFPYLEGDEIRPPRMAPPFEALDARLRELAVRAFHEGHADPEARPSAAEWRAGLLAAEAELVTCASSPQHRHAPHLMACPWCRRRQLLGGRDPFPLRAELPAPPVRVHDRAPDPDPPAPAPVAAPRRPLGRMVRPAGGDPWPTDPLVWALPALVFLMTSDIPGLPVITIVALLVIGGLSQTRQRDVMRSIVATLVLTLMAFGVGTMLGTSSYGPGALIEQATAPERREDPSPIPGLIIGEFSSIYGDDQAIMREAPSIDYIGEVSQELATIREVLGARGECCLRAEVIVTISPRGVPGSKIQIHELNVDEAVVANALAALVGRMRFYPALNSGGHPFETTVRVPITIMVQGGTPTPVASQSSVSIGSMEVVDAPYAAPVGVWPQLISIGTLPLEVTEAQAELKRRGRCCADGMVEVTLSDRGIPQTQDVAITETNFESGVVLVGMVNAITHMRFTPARDQAGNPVEVRVRFPITLTVD